MFMKVDNFSRPNLKLSCKRDDLYVMNCYCHWAGNSSLGVGLGVFFALLVVFIGVAVIVGLVLWRKKFSRQTHQLFRNPAIVEENVESSYQDNNEKREAQGSNEGESLGIPPPHNPECMVENFASSTAPILQPPKYMEVNPTSS